MLHLTPRITPRATGVFPLLKKGLREAFELYKSLQAAGLRVEFDGRAALATLRAWTRWARLTA